MGVSDDTQQLALMRFDFTNGAHRGSALMLYPRCLVHRSDSELETVPLARVTAIRVAFARDRRRLGWGIALVVIALVLLMLSAALSSWAHRQGLDVTQNAPAGRELLLMFLRFVEMTAALLPSVALASAVGGAALGVLGWLGSTTLTLALGGDERRYRVRGRDTLLLDFSQLAAERLMALAR